MLFFSENGVICLQTILLKQCLSIRDLDIEERVSDAEKRVGHGAERDGEVRERDEGGTEARFEIRTLSELSLHPPRLFHWQRRSLFPDETQPSIMKVFHHDACALHNPPYEILFGRSVPYYEHPERLHKIRQALEQRGDAFEFVSAEDAYTDIEVDTYINKVHSAEYLTFLRTAYQKWCEAYDDPEVGTWHSRDRWRLEVVLLSPSNL